VLFAIAYLVPLALALFGDLPWAWLVIPIALPIALPLVTAIQNATGKGLIPVLVGTSRLTFIFAALFAFGIIL
jgi:1,4-dihydroxy-2-naphthoate octaprenyltransferase